MKPARGAEPAGRAAPLVVLAAVGLAYANAFAGAFQFDDWNVIVGDARVQSLAAWWQSMPGIRPLLKLTYAVNHASGLGVAGFHAVNVALHAANALLVLALLRRLALRHGAEGATAGLAALAGALLFAVHPVQTEAVTYLSGRSTALAATFALASLLAWVTGREEGRPWLAAVVSPLLLAAGLASKEYVAVLPLALVLWRATDPRREPGFAGALHATGPHWLVLLGGLAVFAASDTYRRLVETSLEARGIGENLLLQAQAVVYLAGQLVRIDRLNADPLLAAPVFGITAALSVAAVAAGVIGGFALLRTRPAAAFGVLWFFLWLAPTNSLLPRLDLVNDRQLYLALMGPAWLVAWTIATLPHRRAAAVALAAALAGLVLATAGRNAVYADEVAFWEDVARKSPGNARALNNLGYAYAQAGRRDDAEAAFVRALAVSPQDWRAASNLRLLREGALPAGAQRR